MTLISVPSLVEGGSEMSILSGKRNLVYFWR